MTKEDIVDELGKLVGRLDAAGYRAVVGIDELDKLEVDEDTADLLNSMKSLFAIPSCSFIVTISSSAWSTFEQRGIRMRTVFDSSLDEVVEARPLSFLDARSVIRRRSAHMSDTQILFASASSGGIARDLLRNARRMALIGEAAKSDLKTADAVSQFVEDEALSKIDAAILDLRSTPESADVDQLAAKLDDRRRALSDHGLGRGDEHDLHTSMLESEEPSWIFSCTSRKRGIGSCVQRTRWWHRTRHRQAVSMECTSSASSSDWCRTSHFSAC